jgi:hypothetical protein
MRRPSRKFRARILPNLLIRPSPKATHPTGVTSEIHPRQVTVFEKALRYRVNRGQPIGADELKLVR